MSQIDYIHYLPTLIWLIVLFVVFYMLMIVLIIPLVYKTLRVRGIQDFNYWKNIFLNMLIVRLNIIIIFRWWKIIIRKVIKYIIVISYIDIFKKN